MGLGGDVARGTLESWSRDAPGRRGCWKPGRGKGRVENRMSSEDSPTSFCLFIIFFKFYFFGCTRAFPSGREQGLLFGCGARLPLAMS